MPDYLRFDPAACAFPRPAVPLLPALQWSGLALAAHRGNDGARHYARGRYALHAAYRAAGLGPGTRLLAPSYHCRTMLDPALALGADIDFYPVGASLAPDLDAIEALLGQGGALVLPHYFGIEQDGALMQQLLALCRARGTTLVEDCSHAWLVAAQRAPLRQGPLHSIVASPYKFFPCEDGGLLWSEAAPPATRAPGLLQELKGLRSAWQRSRAAARVPAAAPLRDDGRRGQDVREQASGPSGLYARAAEQQASLALSRWVMRHAAVAPVVARRRQHYARWVAALAGATRARPLFAQLPDGCAPYMLALLVDDADPVFYQLKQQGMPIWRWDDMAVSNCPVAQQYRTRLLHLPCHQGLHAAQMDWMTALVAQAVA